jgi:hypothetical protein
MQEAMLFAFDRGEVKMHTLSMIAKGVWLHARVLTGGLLPHATLDAGLILLYRCHPLGFHH